MAYAHQGRFLYLSPAIHLVQPVRVHHRLHPEAMDDLLAVLTFPPVRR
jgi:hypothetical protein